MREIVRDIVVCDGIVDGSVEVDAHAVVRCCVVDDCVKPRFIEVYAIRAVRCCVVDYCVEMRFIEVYASNTIQVGDDTKGRQLVEAIAGQTDENTRGSELIEMNAGLPGCGSVVNANDIASATAMADYVAGVFYAPVLDSESYNRIWCLRG